MQHEQRIRVMENSYNVHEEKLKVLEQLVQDIVIEGKNICGKTYAAVTKSSSGDQQSESQDVPIPFFPNDKTTSISSGLRVQLPPENASKAQGDGLPKSAVASQREDKDGFMLPREQIRKIRKQGVIGSRKGSASHLRSGTEHTDIFVYRVHNDHDDVDVTNFLQDENVHILSISKVSHSDSRMKSFKVKIRTSDMEKVMSDQFWPDGIGCRKYFYRKQVENINELENKNGGYD